MMLATITSSYGDRSSFFACALEIDLLGTSLNRAVICFSTEVAEACAVSS